MTRRGAAGTGAEAPFLPEQAITLAQALSAATADTASQAGDEGAAGTLTVATAAGLAVTSEDVMRLPPDRLHDVEVMGTWLRGAVVHRSAELTG